MNGKQRILTALDGGTADRVPTYVHGINEASIIRAGRHFTDGLPDIKPAHFMEPDELMKLADTLMVLHEELEIDGITGVPLEEEEDLDDDHFRNDWGIVKARSPHGLPVPVGHPIATEADLDAYERPRPEAGRCTFVAELQRARFGEEKARFFMVRGVFTNSWYLHGMEPLLLNFIRAPRFVHKLARLVTEYCRDLIDLAADVGVHAIVMDDDLADKHNPMISPRHYAEFVQPYHTELVAHAHDLGMKVVLHSDGNVWPLLDQMAATGIDGINPLEPEAGMDLEKVKQAYGDRLCLVGNIDCGELLCNGTPEEVEAVVRHAIEVAAPGGGYILCDSNSIHPGVAPENFIAMMRAAKRYGAYAEGARA